MTQPLTEITNQGEAVHGFYRGQLFLSFVIFPPSGCVAKEDPVGGLVACTPESFRINKGLQPENRVVAQGLPVSSNTIGTPAQQMGCQMWRLNPGQQEETGVIRKQVTMFFQGI